MHRNKEYSSERGVQVLTTRVFSLVIIVTMDFYSESILVHGVTLKISGGVLGFLCSVRMFLVRAAVSCGKFDECPSRHRYSWSRLRCRVQSFDECPSHREI